MVALQKPVYAKLAELVPHRYRLAGINVLCPRIQQQIPLALLPAVIALTAALCFSFALSATLRFKRGLQPMRARADLKGIAGAVVPLYASTQCHFMVQGTLGFESGRVFFGGGA